jgi:hypothetical protein
VADDAPARVEGHVRTEHDLRNQLRIATARIAMLERVLGVARDYAYGVRGPADLRRLKTVLARAGFPDPKEHADRTPGDSRPESSV